MLARIEPAHADFSALAAYLLYGRSRPAPKSRVAWTLAHNLITEDPLKAAAIMAATADRSRRCRNPCYHASINWHQDERPTPDAMREVALKTLALAGLAGHQALIMGHGDKPHAHLHMMINRVHPDTGRAWSTAHDYRQFDRIMKQLAGEHGFLYVPGHAFEPEATDAVPKRPGRGARRAAAKGADTGRIQGRNDIARWIGSEVSAAVDRATGWDDIAFALESYGLTLEPKGQGLVAGNQQGYFKFSRLGLSVSANGLAKRFGRKFARSKTNARRPAPTRRHSHRRILTVDAVDIARAIGSRENLRSAVREAKARCKARIARTPLMQQLMEEVKQTLKTSTCLTPARHRLRPNASFHNHQSNTRSAKRGTRHSAR